MITFFKNYLLNNRQLNIGLLFLILQSAYSSIQNTELEGTRTAKFMKCKQNTKKINGAKRFIIGLLHFTNYHCIDLFY